MPEVTHYVALPFLQDDAGEPLIGEPTECQNPVAAIRRAEAYR
jgi:hypothetical protein